MLTDPATDQATVAPTAPATGLATEAVIAPVVAVIAPVVAVIAQVGAADTVAVEVIGAAAATAAERIQGDRPERPTSLVVAPSALAL